jgi:dTDP-4-dehydrorhamnose reductase
MYPSHDEFDVVGFNWTTVVADVIVHAAAVTSPPVADKDPISAVSVNIVGTSSIVACASFLGARVVYISTDYVFPGDDGPYKPEDDLSPVNRYAWSKLGGECAVRMYDKGLIVRGSFGAVPFPYDKAFVDQYTSRIPVTEFARRLVEIVEQDPPRYGVVHIAGKRQTVLEYARSVSPEKEIGPLRRDEVSFKVPYDTSLLEDDDDE